MHVEWSAESNSIATALRNQKCAALTELASTQHCYCSSKMKQQAHSTVHFQSNKSNRHTALFIPSQTSLTWTQDWSTDFRMVKRYTIGFRGAYTCKMSRRSFECIADNGGDEIVSGRRCLSRVRTGTLEHKQNIL